MIVQMDNMSAPSSRERAQRLYEKTVELENKRRKSAQARIPSDPNAWQQIRENYEAIILEDHAFSEQHNIEYALWQLHYKRIEEFRAHFSAALASTGSSAPQTVKGPVRPDRVTKIRNQFKTFLSEASGFYHDLILKIKAKYGLPLGHFSEDSENQIVTDKDDKKSSDVRKGLVSSHRCLIYLGDLARYKGLYGEGDSKTREYTAASSYYLQAASLLPGSGNPHHQLAIVASYSGDELVAVYRYFRSLAVESPFSTARDNLIVAFEKNRQSYSQLLGEVKASLAKDLPKRLTGKGRGKGEPRHAHTDSNSESSVEKEKICSIPEMYRTFCTKFIRLNGILFTRTSLEMFSEVLTSVSTGLCELLSSGPEEDMNFGSDATENMLAVVRLVSILIYTVHNSKKETEGQTYAEIVQRAVLLQNAFTAVFELLGCIINRCVQLRDSPSSYLIPGILVFVEWLACCPDVATGSDADENQAVVRSTFWKHCITFFNKILSSGPIFIDENEDETCFFNMTRYDEGETENRLALLEDFELRGFLPLIPAQTILDFSRKHSFGSDGNKEKKARIKRILAAGKSLANMIRVDHKTVCFNAKMKKFIIGFEPSDNTTLTTRSIPSNLDDASKDNLGTVQPNAQVYVDSEDEDEVIVFKPVVTEKRAEVPGQNYAPYDGLKKPDQIASTHDLQFYGNSVSAPLDNLCQQSCYDTRLSVPVSVGSIFPQHLRPVQQYAAVKLLPEQDSLASSFAGLKVGKDHVAKHVLSGNIDISCLPDSYSSNLPCNVSTNGMLYGQSRAPEISVLSKIDAIASSGVTAESLSARTSSPIPAVMKKNPVSRPVRHLGPPPGFNPVPQKQMNEPVSRPDLTGDNLLMDDYSWLDGYQASLKGSMLNNSANYPHQPNNMYIGNSNGFNGAVNFPFPGKQVPTMKLQVDDHYTLEHLRQQHVQQHLVNGNQLAPLPEQYQEQSGWTGRYFV